MKQRLGKDRAPDSRGALPAVASPPVAFLDPQRPRVSGRLDALSGKPGLYRLPVLLLSLWLLLSFMTGYFSGVSDGNKGKPNVEGEANDPMLRRLREFTASIGHVGEDDKEGEHVEGVQGLVHGAKMSSSTCLPKYILTHSGFRSPVLDSTVLMLFAACDPPQYQYDYERTKRRPYAKERTESRQSTGGTNPAGGIHTTGLGKCTPLHDRDYVESTFARVAAAFLTSPFADRIRSEDDKVTGQTGTKWAPGSHLWVGSDDEEVVMPYYDFFRAHEATFWEITEHSTDGGAAVRRVASPLQMDLLYTYVNPAAPSFRHHLIARNITHSAQRRYNDWEELRYSLRSVMANVIGSGALMQRPRQLAGDVAALEALGYEVDLRIRRSPWERGTTAETERREVITAHDAPFPLFRTLYLLLSNADQVPAWLDLASIPCMRVVLHEDIFEEEKFPGVLPTFSSNAIEMGMYRVPGLSRFYLYLNNDFMIGSPVSFFDLYRPISPARQRLRLLHEELTSAAKTVRGAAAAECGVEKLSRRFIHLDAQMRSEMRKIQWRLFFTEDPNVELNSRAREHESSCARNATIATVGQLLTNASAVRNAGTHGNHRSNTSLLAPPRSSSADGNTAFLARWLPPKVAVDLLTRPGLRTSVGFSVPNPNITDTPWERGTPPTHQHHYIVTNRLEGLLPPFNLAHHPYLRDRYVERVLLEDIYTAEAQQCRLAYDRTMSPFSIIHPYAVITAGFARARVREQWRFVLQHGMVESAQAGVSPAVVAAVEEFVNDLTRRLAATVLGPNLTGERRENRARGTAALYSLPQLASTVSIPTAVSYLGPLYGDTVSVRLQAPDLVEELGLWWLPGARPPTVVSSSPEDLSTLYEIPELRLILRRGGDGRGEEATYVAHGVNHTPAAGQKTCGSSSVKSSGNGDGKGNRNDNAGKHEDACAATASPSPFPFVYAYNSAHYRKLLHDVAHINNPEPAYRFDAFASVAELDKLTKLWQEWVGPRSTYVCLNDDFATESFTDAEVAEIKVRFKKLMAAIIGYLPPGSWEKG